MASAVAAGGGPLLIVEDDVDIREALQTYLELQGYEVRVAGDGREALAHLAALPPPSLILLDMGLPVLDGHRVLTARGTDPALARVPVVILSAETADMSPRDRAVYAASQGVAAFLPKPVDPKRLLETLRRLLPGLAAPQADAPV
ncbi:response regulator [Myxococcus sp. CA056]|nr:MULTISPECIES: response regulator [unclassified Myxococcus]NTX11197.1 response regulator [Myxococcus sp. CA056]NTX34706.1 response regulator [Myxococcus sp. CA033]NTX50335.1 response regulator [Myxococcus sp. CA039A]